MDLNWVEGFLIAVKIRNRTVTLSANKEGLLSLANHLITLANEADGAHIHFDEMNSLEDDSDELIVEKKDHFLRF